ncbi:AAA family ATPase [Nonomuraea sp. NPDC046802]|uniref:ATP-binding protein n=1 Tax=Nonomuraea sp. NPDC046802 TaxID=3154919 RepID=UPI0033D02AF0
MKDPPARPVRRNVVILFVDLVGSTALAERLDPELLHRVLDRYYSRCTATIGEYGGAVEKFIGDAVMAVFGASVSHEDDAVRAVRAAEAIRTAVRGLGAEPGPSWGIELDIHGGIAAGEAVVISSGNVDPRVIGDVVNTAARLQGAAAAGEILLDVNVAAMARPYASVEPTTPLTLKGKSGVTQAYRLISLEREDPEYQAELVDFIGREGELAQLAGIYRRVLAGRCCIATVLGAAGLGKSRLVREFVQTNCGPDVRVIGGTCRSYGRAAAFRPIAEMLESLGDDWRAAVAGLEQEERVVRGLSAMLTQPAEPVSVEEVSYAVRLLFEALATERPLVVVWENLQWAQPGLLGLINDVAAWLADVPVLLLCLARPDLLELRADWGGGLPCSTTLELEPLDEAECAQLVAALVPRMVSTGEVTAHGADELSQRALTVCAGNPLFAEMVLATGDLTDSATSVPMTVRSVLSARLDQLGRGERDLLERAATVGLAFTRDDLRPLLDDEEAGEMIESRLRRLLRSRLITRAGAPGAYRFAQTLFRDTAYALTSKADRAAWHLTLADLHPLDESSDLVDHLEAAYVFRKELRPDDPALPGLATRAALALIEAGTRVLGRKDLHAAIMLLERGQELLPAGRREHARLAVLICDIAVGLGEPGRGLAALDAAEAAGADALTCAAQRGIVAVLADTDFDETAEPADDGTGEELGRGRACYLRGLRHLSRAEYGLAERSLREGLELARSTGDAYEQDRLLVALCELAQWSPTHLDAGLELCAHLGERFAADRSMLVPVLLTQARLTALSGDTGAARALVEVARRHAQDLRMERAIITVDQVAGLLDWLDGRNAQAVACFDRAAGALRAAGMADTAVVLDVYAARGLMAQGRQEAAVERFRQLEAGAAGHVRAKLIMAAFGARCAALTGPRAEAVTRAAQAGDLLAMTDDPCLLGDVLIELSHAYQILGMTAEARAAAERATAGYAGKGAELPARSARARVAAL